ncbi:PRP38-domain-containing protein [Trichodelitschia bisporula]|uniref:Pre-mRNA-splicing factor 38 n=1 Tax=Trichodelitschia bisporula TaxID=703511 RepID=A0A6G1HY77_9PEZI|nr:PRP38-domain-containing protein [Trichodelitschia bisporula]
MATHKPDARALLDDRGYSGALIRGQNPALLIEKAVRDRITESYYWKEQCFGLNAATLCDRAASLAFIGGTYGGVGKPTPFLCLLFKMLQLVPERAIVLEYLNFRDRTEEDEVEEGEGENEGAPEEKENEEVVMRGFEGLGKPRGDFKYLRALAAFYIRLAWEPVEIYRTLEPLLSDWRKLKRRTREGFVLTTVDQFVDDLLTKDRVCATALWKIPARSLLEDLELLEPRVSPLGDELEELENEMEGVEEMRNVGSEEGERREDSADEYRDRSASRDSRDSYRRDRSASDDGYHSRRRSTLRDDSRRRSRTSSPNGYHHRSRSSDRDNHRRQSRSPRNGDYPRRRRSASRDGDRRRSRSSPRDQYRRREDESDEDGQRRRSSSPGSRRGERRD